MKLSNRLLPFGLLLLVPALSGCGSKTLRATSLIGDNLLASIEDRPGERTVRVVTTPMGTRTEGPMLLTVQPFVDGNSNMMLDEGEAIGQTQRVGNGKSASLRLETIDFTVPKVSGDDVAMLSIELASEASRLTMTAWRDPETGFWKQMATERGTLTSR